MTAFTFIAELVASLAWPLTVLAITLLFRRQLVRLFQRIAKIEYAGGSISLQEEVSRLDKKRTQAAESAPFQPQDLEVLLGSLEGEAERELFRVAQIEARGGAVSATSLGHLVVLLREQDALPAELLDAVNELSAIVRRLRSTSGVPQQTLKKVLTSAHQLLYQLHKHGLVVRMVYEFASHGFWHMHQQLSGPARRYYWWSAVASECPEFEYDYKVYFIAATRYNQRLSRSLGSEAAERGLVEVVSLEDYVAILRFRESELTRVLETAKSAQDSFSEANTWRWPEHWGDVRWSGPVVRGSNWSAERDLRETRRAIRLHEERLEAAA